jgi:tetratricopeptide (TPR) repeat protein
MGSRLHLLVYVVLLLTGCASFQTAGDVQSGRQALLIRQPEQALPYFQRAAARDPNYIFQSGLYREGIWTYVGRTQYTLGQYPAARESLERALSQYNDDYLAQLYLGLTMVRTGDERGVKEIEAGLKGLHDWLEYINASRPFQAFWDPLRQIRSEIEKDLKMLSGKDVDSTTLIASGEWVGHQMEDEIDRVRRDESEYYRRREYDSPGRGVGVGIGVGF